MQFEIGSLFCTQIENKLQSQFMSKIKTNQLMKKNRLLDKGAMFFLKKGYHGTGLKEILDSEQIPKASFYYYFNSKEEFTVEVIDHYLASFIKRLNAHLKNPALDGLESLKLYYTELIADFEQNGCNDGCLLGNLIGEIGDNSSLCRQALLDGVNRLCDLQIIALERGQQQGKVRSDRSAKELAGLLFNSWQGALLRMKVDRSTAPLKACYQEYLEDYFKP
jgi:TetR/AcrR family transcriptional repressor of nem operon